MSRSRRRAWRSAIAVPIFAVVGIVYAFPLYWLFVTSLKSKAELYQADLSLYPEAPTLQPYLSVLVERGFWALLRNSILVCSLSVVVALVVVLLITYPITRLVLPPPASPGLSAAAVIVFTFSWSEFLFALILTSTQNAQTFPVGVQGLVTQFEVIWNDMAAAGTIALALPLVLMVLARRYVIAGLTFGVVREK